MSAGIRRFFYFFCGGIFAVLDLDFSVCHCHFSCLTSIVIVQAKKLVLDGMHWSKIFVEFE